MLKHLAIIMDGSRRYARKHHLQLYKGHEKGAEIVKKLISWSHELGIKELTLYAMSIQNFNRTKQEVFFLFNLAESFFIDLLNSIESGKKELSFVQFNFMGRLSLFPKKLQSLMKELNAKTKHNKGLIVNIAMAYGGREEIVDAIKNIVKKGIKTINEKTIADNLYLDSEPDIIIRTGGEQRTSNFLPWQSVYSEWFFIKKLWPEFTKADLKRVIAQYSNRERRFGI